MEVFWIKTYNSRVKSGYNNVLFYPFQFLVLKLLKHFNYSFKWPLKLSNICLEYIMDDLGDNNREKLCKRILHRTV